MNVASHPCSITQLPPDLCQQPYNSLDNARAPWTLGRVCSSWRILMLSTSSLWSTLTIASRRWLPRPRHLECLREHLRRSRDQPLQIGITVICVDVLDVVADMMKLLIEHSHRWKLVEFVLGYEGYGCLFDLMSRSEGEFPLLEEFYIIGEPSRRSDMLGLEKFDWLATPSLCAPRLRRAALPSTRLQIAPVEGLPLTHLEAGIYALSDVQYISSYTYATEVHLTCFDIDQVDLGGDISAVIVPQITTLGVDSLLMLRALTLPSLEVLLVYDSTCDSQCEILHQFLQRSVNSLKTLFIFDKRLLCRLDLTHVVFRNLVDITVLYIPSSIKMQESVAKLTQPDALLSLRSITLIFTFMDLTEDRDIIDQLMMVLETRSNVKALVEVDCCMKHDLQVLKRELGALEREGKLTMVVKAVNDTHDSGWPHYDPEACPEDDRHAWWHGPPWSASRGSI
ncbi:hypothetical protein BDZ89DRAFT_1165999 [Hymenopellis radicata]|nr:hypothetical protein BDZ89DRAFT_1165999 [Hymenopellis radicata]